MSIPIGQLFLSYGDILLRNGKQYGSIYIELDLSVYVNSYVKSR